MSLLPEKAAGGWETKEGMVLQTPVAVRDEARSFLLAAGAEGTKAQVQAQAQTQAQAQAQAQTQAQTQAQAQEDAQQTQQTHRA